MATAIEGNPMRNSIWMSVLAAVSLTAAAPADASEAIARKTSCLACHSVESRIVGPAYREVAAKYRNNPFAGQIIRWKVRNGTGKNKPLPMPAFDKKALSDADLESITNWILGL